MPWLGHHELVAVRIDTHREVKWIFGSVVRFAGEAATMRFEFFNGRTEVLHLEREASPSAFAFATAVDPNDAVGHFDLGPDFGFHGHRATEEVAVKGDGALPIGSPESVFGLENCHGGNDGSDAGKGNCGPAGRRQ